MSTILYLALVASTGQQAYVDSGGYYYTSTPYYTSYWSGPGWSGGYWGPSRWFGWSPFGRRYYTNSYPTYSYPVSTDGSPVYTDDGTVYSAPCRGVNSGADTAYDDVDGRYSAARPDLGEQVHRVQMIQGVGFEPGMLRINVGDTVEWRNDSRDTHTVTFDPQMAADASHVALPKGAEAFDSGDIAPGDSFTHTFDQPGIYHYVCLPHEDHGMVGTIVVRDPNAEQEAGAAPEAANPPAPAADDELPVPEPPQSERY